MSAQIEVSKWTPQSGSVICICGIGARTAVGLTAAASAAAVRANISGIGLHPSYTDLDGEAVSFAADPAIDPDMPIGRRMLVMLDSVATEALSQLPPEIEIDRCLVAVPEQRAGLSPDLGTRLVALLSEETSLPLRSVAALPRGHAGGLMVLQEAARMLSQGEIETALVVGVDSYHHRQTIRSLDVNRRLMATRNPGGFPPGEGAGACLLVGSAAVKRYGLPVLGRIRSAASAVEPHPLRSNDPCLGEALTSVVASAASELKRPDELIGDSYCDLNGERYRSEEFCYTLLRTQEFFVDAHDYVAPADCYGDVGAASGMLFAAIAIRSGMRGYARGDFPLLWAGSDSGYRAAVLLALGHS